MVQPFEDHDAGIRCIAMRAERAMSHVVGELSTLAIHCVNLSQPFGDPSIGCHWKSQVIVAVDEEERLGSGECSDGGKLPAVRVYREHAVAMESQDLVGNVAFPIG